MRNACSIFIICFCLCSCTINYSVFLKQDGTALIETETHPSFINRLENSNVISEIDTIGYGIKFIVKNVDSIGNYIPNINPGFVRFSVYGDSIKISSGHGVPFDCNNGCSCCGLFLKVKSEENLEAYKSDGKRIKKHKKLNEYLFTQGKREQLKGKININVTLLKKN